MQQIEETIFSKKRWNPAHMIAYGFQKAGDDYSYTGTFLSGDFQAILSVSAAGVVKGTVIDKMTDDEYAPLRQQSAVGTYVRTVRAAYENWLCQIAASCCDDVLFASNQANRMTEYIRVTYQVLPDFPWSHPAKKATPYQAYGVFRHVANKKWFALILNVPRKVVGKDGDDTAAVDIMNVKIDVAQGDDIRRIPGVYPAYHMNHKNWISIVLDDTVTDEVIQRLVTASHELTK